MNNGNSTKKNFNNKQNELLGTNNNENIPNDQNNVNNNVDNNNDNNNVNGSTNQLKLFL